MQVNSLAVIDTDAPPPLSPLQDVVISPANIAAEARRQRAQTLSLLQRWRLRKHLGRIRKELKGAKYSVFLAHYKELRPRMEGFQEAYHLVRQGLEESPGDSELLERLQALKEEMKPDLERWQLLKSDYRTIQPLLQAQNTLSSRLEDDSIARQRNQLERKLMRAIVKEARIYEKLIIHKWTALGFAYKRQEGDKYKVDKVKFSEVSITLDAIYYKIDASYRTALNNWQTNVPQGVYIGSQLLKDETLVELSIACQRQVTGIYNTNGAWVIVHRLDSVDGLMNYVPFGDTLARYPFKYHSKMPICVGVGVARKVQWVNLSDFPHWLIGGFTNSGKSNMVNVGICTLITKQSPHDLRLILIDMKGGLEFSYYNGIPHLHGENAIETIEDIANTLAELEAIMQSRFRKFKGVAKHIEDYHRKRPGDYMPRILCVFDEVASLMDHGDLTKQILSSLRELTRMGRAVGIHVWLCTQRPDVKAVDGQIKNNLSVRLSGRMSSTADSMTIVGSGAAKDLASVPGRMILQLGPDPTPVQTPHITPEDIEQALAIAKAFPTPPALDVPDYKQVIHQVWTVDKIIELSIKHLGGKITWKAVYEAADNLSQAQARELVERIWAMERIDFGGKSYRVEVGRSNVRRLVEITEEAA